MWIQPNIPPITPALAKIEAMGKQLKSIRENPAIPYQDRKARIQIANRQLEILWQERRTEIYKSRIHSRGVLVRLRDRTPSQ